MKRTKLAEARYSKGWSQEEASEQVGVTRSTFSLWESGKLTPYPIHVHRLCEIFGKTAEELDLVQKSQEVGMTEVSEAILDQDALMRNKNRDGTISNLSRRETILRVLGFAGAVAVAPMEYDLWERLSQAASQPSALNTMTLHRLEHLIIQGWELSNNGKLDAAADLLARFLPIEQYYS